MTGKTYRFIEDGNHYNGGAVFFGYGYRAVGEPRLKMIRRWYRQGDMRGKTEDRFFVDGVEAENYIAAVNALSVPVAFTPEEVAALRMIADEPSDLRSVINFEIRKSLHDKGAIEYGPPGSFRRTATGRAALVTS